MTTRDVDTFINVLKRREEILYRSLLQDNSVSISYANTVNLSSSNSITISDRSSVLSGNQIEDIDISNFYNVSTIETNTDKFLVTDVFTDTVTFPTPLFYKHIISDINVPRSQYSEILGLDSNVILMNVEILDELFQPLKNPAIYVDYDSATVYSNFESTYTSATDYKVYYIRYSVRRSASGVVYTYTDLLSQQPAFTLAELDDLTSTMIIKQDGRKVYMISDTATGYLVTLPTSSTYAFKPTNTSKLQLLPSVVRELDEPWFIRINNGSFKQVLFADYILPYKYYIAEFFNQSFNPYYPIKYSNREKSTVIDTSLIKLDYENIYLNEDDNLFVNIEINDANDVGLAAFTTDTRASGATGATVGTIATNGAVFRYWDDVNRKGIRSIDKPRGILHIEGVDLLSTYNIISTYYFEEYNYEYSLINFNPISNSDILKSQVSIFVDSEGAYESKSQTLYYLIVNEAGKVTQSNWDEYDNDTSLMADSGLPLYYEEPPNYLSLSFGSYERFIEDYTVACSGIASSGTFLPLGDITVANPANFQDIVLADSRHRGGGIIASGISLAREYQPEVDWYWDVGRWDGIPYPGTASYMVEVPITILEDAGGIFRGDEVRDIVNRHTAFGVYPVIRAYGINVTVTGIQPSATSISLNWDYLGYPIEDE